MVDYSDAGNIRDVIFSDPEVAKGLSPDISDTAARRREPYTSEPMNSTFIPRLSSPGLTRRSMDARVKPGHDGRVG